ncbi:hypothetical protein [Cohnella massiliensis]|uniref:hypothetical protein n=1 Tax=Cohnella massiliensis TaxID=1816691 RepID=UPI0009BC0541|nr:hypothetical protein [Cohnella massiliensis]
MIEIAEFKSLLDEIRSESQRLSHFDTEAEYTEYVALIENRQRLVDFLARFPSVAEDEKEAIQELARYEKGLLARMEAFKREALDGLRKLDDSKKQRDAYAGSYGSMEGFMFDKRR